MGTFELTKRDAGVFPSGAAAAAAAAGLSHPEIKGMQFGKPTTGISRHVRMRVQSPLNCSVRSSQLLDMTVSVSGRPSSYVALTLTLKTRPTQYVNQAGFAKLLRSGHRVTRGMIRSSVDWQNNL
jgi:hypothetical protein